MTHGEIRGSLTLLLIMAVVIIAVWLSKRAAVEDSGQQQPVQPATTLSSRQIDSLRLEESATRYDRADSVSRSDAATSTTPADSTDTSSTQQSRPRPSSTKATRPQPSPTPSPLDRPI